MDSKSKAMESTKTALATAASIAASGMLARSLINEFMPSEFRNYISIGTKALRARFTSEHIIIIHEMEGFSANKIFYAVETYLGTRISPSMRKLRVSKLNDEKKKLTISLEIGQEIIDAFQGVPFKWQLHCHEDKLSSSKNIRSLTLPTEIRSYELKFHKNYKDMALDSYLPYILDRSKAIKAENRTLKLYMNERDHWHPINLHHPATFDTLAMDSGLKEELMEDLARFVNRKDYYKKIGKAWKRGYLLYGPAGTGKSSLVAAMANYLHFDIYDLELTEVTWNSNLRRLLVGMANRSILVVEDIDCSMELQNREEQSESKDGKSKSSGSSEKLTLSGLLNFVDGLWSSCGEERIIVFTTNYKEKLDPALLRPGRMDMHVHMGYCSASAFRTLASNYHDIDEHLLFEEIEGLIGEVEVTPAEVAEELMRSGDTEIALRGLVKFLQGKRKGESDAEIKEEGIDE